MKGALLDELVATKTTQAEARQRQAGLCHLFLFLVLSSS
jgi:hypothetical protein